MTLRYRKIGGIHWLWLGRAIITFTWGRAKPAAVTHERKAA